MNNSPIQRFLFGMSGLFLAGCELTEPQPASPIATAKASPLGTAMDNSSKSTHDRGPHERTIGEFKFEIPPAWEEKSLSSTVLLAEYVLPSDAGSGRLTFSSAGGGKEANLDRWKQQFLRGPDDPEPKESSLRVAGKTAILIELAGKFTDMFGGASPKEHWQMLGVVIPIDADHNFFIKLTGPKETVAARREEFLNLLSSARGTLN